jgi:hypothetical protein
MRPGPTADRGKISEYVGAVRGARRRLSNAKPGTANAAEAKQGLKDNRQALSRRIQRERGARRGLKPATSQQVLTGTVPAPPARRTKAARPSNTLAKPRNLKPGAIAARKAKAAASGARAARATANYNRAQKAALEAQQRVNRRRSPKNLAAADRAQKTLQSAARAYRILVGLGGKKLAVAKKPSPKGSGPRMKAARPAGTVVKPKGLKVGALASQSNPQPQRKRKVDYTGAVKLLSRQKAAINRLKNPQQTFNGNAAYARQVDVRTAKSTPAANAQREIRALYGEYRRAQSSAKSQYASQEVRTRAASELPTLRKKIRKAVQSARAFKPEYSAEARRRFQAAQARNRR